MNERIKKMRKELGFTQQRFANELGMKQNTIATYEMGRAIPSDSTIKFICYKFGVNEDWLRTGEGEMFVQESAFDLGEYAKRHGMTALEMEILKAYLELGSDVRKELLQHFKERLAKTVAPEAGKDTPVPTSLDASGQERPELDIAAELAELKRQNEEKDKQLQELAAEITALKEEDIANGLWDGLPASPSESTGSHSPTEKAKK